jgi:hypothetical protein
MFRVVELWFPSSSKVGQRRYYLPELAERTSVKSRYSGGEELDLNGFHCLLKLVSREDGDTARLAYLLGGV